MSRTVQNPDEIDNTANVDSVAKTDRDDTNGNNLLVLEVSAAYNRDRVPMPKPNGPNGKRVLNLEMLMNHPLYWDFLNDRETEEVLMELYITRTRRMQ